MEFQPIPPPSSSASYSESFVPVTFRTVANRRSTITIHRARTTFTHLIDTIAHEFGLKRTTVKFIHDGAHLRSVPDVLMVAELAAATQQHDDHTHTAGTILVVGSKDVVASTPAPSPPTPLKDDSAQCLKFPHIPGGLDELTRIIAEPEELSVLFDKISAHPTMEHICYILSKGTTDTSSGGTEAVLSRILQQIKDHAPSFFQWINQQPSFFLHVLNRRSNPYTANFWGVLSQLGVTEVEIQHGRPVLVVGSDVDITGDDNVQMYYEAEVAIVSESDPDGGGPDDDAFNFVSDSKLNEIEQLAALEESLNATDDIVMESTIMQELALRYEALYHAECMNTQASNANGVGQGEQPTFSKAPLYESKTSLWFRKATAALVRAVQNIPASPDGDNSSSTWTMSALCSVSPTCFVGAQLWFKERDPMCSIAACIAHLKFWEIVEAFNQSLVPEGTKHADPAAGTVLGHHQDFGGDDAASVVYSHPGTVRASAASAATSCARTEDSVVSAADSVEDPFQETMRLIRYTQEHHTTVVLYSLLGPGSMLIYVVRPGSDIRIVQAAVSHDGFKGSMMFLEDALQRRRFGVNLNMMWTEHLTSMYNALVRPIEQWLPPVPTEVDDADAGQVCFVVSFSPIPLPFAAMLDDNGVPVVAKWAVLQAHVPTDIFAAESVPFLNPTSAATVVLTDGTPSWMTRQLARSIGAAPGQNSSATETTILHVDSMVRHPMATLPHCDFFVCERFETGMRYQIYRSALVRGMKIHEDDQSLAYEFGRSLYLALSEGKTISRAVRLAVMATAAVHPLEPWVWGSMILFNYGGSLPALEHQADKQARRLQRREAEMQRLLRSTTSTPESKYAEYTGINTIYNAMVNSLLQGKPQTQDDIEATLIQCLENIAVADVRSRPSSITNQARVPPGGAAAKMIPAPPDRLPVKPRPTPSPASSSPAGGGNE